MYSMNPISCILIDDEKDALDRLANLLAKNNRIEVKAKETNPENAVKLVAEYRPELVFTDVEMPGRTGFDVVQEIRNAGFNPNFIFVTAYNQYAIKAIRNAAFDYLLKPVDIDELNEALARFLEQKKNTYTKKIPKQFIKEHGLTEREVEILELLMQNKSSKEIAELLFLSKHTVDTHRRNILEKTGKSSTAELLAELSLISA